jgi:ATP synthase protein I
MSQNSESREEAIKRLNDGASDLEARAKAQAAIDLSGQKVAGQAYRIIAELIGGVLVGLALGFGVDRLAGTTPWGLIGGVLLGFAVSIWMAHRTAQRLMAEAKASGVEPQSIPFDDEEDEDR